MGMDFEVRNKGIVVEEMRKPWHLANTCYAYNSCYKEGSSDYPRAYLMGDCIPSVEGLEFTRTDMLRIIILAIVTSRKSYARAWGFCKKRKREYLMKFIRLTKYKLVEISWC